MARTGTDIVSEWEETLEQYPNWEFNVDPVDIELVVEYVRYLEQR